MEIYVCGDIQVAVKLLDMAAAPTAISLRGNFTMRS